jgi:hypothetical protein
MKKVANLMWRQVVELGHPTLPLGSISKPRRKTRIFTKKASETLKMQVIGMEIVAWETNSKKKEMVFVATVGFLNLEGRSRRALQAGLNPTFPG